MIICPRCTKENQNHYKFCLGCGCELPSDAARQPKGFSSASAASSGLAGQAEAVVSSRASLAAEPSPSSRISKPPTPPTGVEARLGSSHPDADEGRTRCPGCASVVPSSFKFCYVCGNPLEREGSVAPAVPDRQTEKPAHNARGRLVFLRSDGSAGDSFALEAGKTVVGREVGGIFSRDFYLSPRHATFLFQGSTLTVADENSLNGVYLRIPAKVPVELADPAVLRMGQQLVRVEAMSSSSKAKISQDIEVAGSPVSGIVGRVSLVIAERETGNSFCIDEDGILLGREGGDVLFPEDGYVSALHCRIYLHEGRLAVMDMGSSNGVFLRINAKAQLDNGSVILLGQQLCRVEY